MDDRTAKSETHCAPQLNSITVLCAFVAAGCSSMQTCFL